MRRGVARTWVPAGAVLAALAGLVLPLAPATTAVATTVEGAGAAGSSAAAATTERYVALGDSYVAGPGIAPLRADGCRTSTKNFPTLLGAALGTEVVDASCGGARLDHLWETQTVGGYTHRPQLEAVTPDTTLVTFGTLGGNDVDLVGLATSCVGGTCAPDKPGEEGSLYQAIEALRPEIAQGLADVAERAPDADVVVVGYSQYVLPTSCAALGGLIDAGEATYLQSSIDHLSRVLEESAEAAGVAFADMNAIPGVTDHTVCAAPERQWVRALNTYGDGAPLHPSTCGMAAYAQQVRRAVQELRGEAPDAFVDPCPDSAPTASPSPTAAPTTAPSATTSPTAVPAPAGPRAALEAAAATTRLVRSCTDAGRVRLTVRGGRGLVARVNFRLGETWVGHATSAPYRVERWSGRLAKHRGKVRAVVVLRLEGERLRHRIAAVRPACLR